MDGATILQRVRHVALLGRHRGFTAVCVLSRLLQTVEVSANRVAAQGIERATSSNTADAQRERSCCGSHPSTAAKW
jgi:hypothetical protein